MFLLNKTLKEFKNHCCYTCLLSFGLQQRRSTFLYLRARRHFWTLTKQINLFYTRLIEQLPLGDFYKVFNHKKLKEFKNHCCHTYLLFFDYNEGRLFYSLGQNVIFGRSLTIYIKDEYKKIYIYKKNNV